MPLFSYTGPDPSQPASYTLTTTPVCNIPTEQLCYIEADNAGGLPILTDDLKDEMLNSLQNQVNGLHVFLKAR